MNTSTILGQPSWEFATESVEAAITEVGGQLAPVRFRLGERIIEPFSIAPWTMEKFDPAIPSMLQVLRGDFFCAPFGGNQSLYQGEQHPPHGESANAKWTLESLQKNEETTEIHLSLQTTVRKGRVDKRIHLREGHTAVYCQHVLSGMSGRMSFGHHAMLKFPDELNSGRISTSPISFGQVAPKPFEDPAKGGYSSLKTGATFRQLDQVPSAFGGTADVSRYPARRGFEDLVMLVHAAREDFAWTAVAFPSEGYVWYALKDPRVLQSTILWISNGGRHYPPFNGRHVNVMGLEEVTSYFHYGLAESAQENAVTREGFVTSVELDNATPLMVNYIMGVAAIPPSFQGVKAIHAEKGQITLISTDGETIQTPVDTEFLYRNSL